MKANAGCIGFACAMNKARSRACDAGVDGAMARTTKAMQGRPTVFPLLRATVANQDVRFGERLSFPATKVEASRATKQLEACALS